MDLYLPFITRFVANEIKPMIAKLCEDLEFDVRYFAEEARNGLH